MDGSRVGRTISLSLEEGELRMEVWKDKRGTLTYNQVGESVRLLLVRLEGLLVRCDFC